MIDLLPEVAGIGGFEQVSASSVGVTVFQRQIRALDLRALIQSKKVAGRPKDLLILPELESLLEAADPD